uniref:Uncharacterized protein n=1 Tax=termite gut metagenome TaxID=433724 RepID=S0DG30_9ZZZZ
MHMQRVFLNKPLRFNGLDKSTIHITGECWGAIGPVSGTGRLPATLWISADRLSVTGAKWII